MTERFASHDEFFCAAFADKEGKRFPRRADQQDHRNPPRLHPTGKLAGGERTLSATRLRHVPGGKEVVVEVEFDSYQARYAHERKFHPTHRRHEFPKGRLRISEAALEQVAQWLMQYGEHAVAQRPPELREMVREKLTKAWASYEVTLDDR